MNKNMNMTNTKNKRIGLILSLITGLFAFTLLVSPATVSADDQYGDTSGIDWGWSGGGNSGGDTSGIDWGWSGGNDNGGNTNSGYDSYDSYGTKGYSSPSYSSYTPSSSYSSPSYSYTPSSSYGGGSSYGENYTPMSYVPYSQGQSQGSTPNYNSNSQGQSQSSNNSNKNTNQNKAVSSSVSSSKSDASAVANNRNDINNVNNNQDTTNNVNNNNISLVVYAAGATSTYSNTSDTNQQLDGYCVINPGTAELGQDLNFMAYPTGGNGSYTYSWSGADGLSSSVQNFTGRFGTPGYKTAHVTIKSGNQIVTKTCSANVTERFVQPGGNTLSAYCVANPTTANVNQVVTWTVQASGGNGSYGYNWTGTDNLFGYSQSIQKSYTTTGTKQASVTITSAGQSASAVCNANVGGSSVSNVTVYRQPTSGTPVSGVFLNQIPDTGIEWSLKTSLFAAGLLLWSAFVAYMLIARRKAVATLATANGISKAEAFKLMNMKKRGLIA